MKIPIICTRLLAILFIHIYSNYSAIGQECGSIASEEFLVNLRQLAAREMLNGSNHFELRTEVVLGVKFYDIHQANRSSTFTNDKVKMILDNLSQIFRPVNVRFQLCSDIIDITEADLQTLNIKYEGDSPDENIIVNRYYDNRVINLYVADFIDYLGVGEIYGRAYFPEDINKHRVFVKKEQIANSTLTHEMGHFFGLIHTHGNARDALCNPHKPTVFDVNNTNYDDAVFDTPIDPGMRCPTSSGSSCNFFNCPILCDCSTVEEGTCRYIGRGAYGNYTPSTNNFMSYMYDPMQNTCRTEFTAGQYERMRSFVDVRRNLICSTSSPTCDTYFEPNSDFASASNYFGVLGASSFSTAIQGKISLGNGDDLDYFKLRFTQTGELRVQLTGLPKDYDLFLYDPYQRKYSVLSGLQSENINFTVTTTDLNKDFFILVYGKTSSDFDCTNPYTLSVTWLPQSSGAICSDQYEPNNSEGNPNLTAFPTPLGSQRYLNTITAKVTNGDIDVFKFKAIQAGTIKVSASVQNVSYACTATLLKGEGLTQLGRASNSGYAEGVFNYAYQGSTAEVFYLKCTATNIQDCNATYKLTLEWIPATVGGGDCTDSYEPNNSLSQAYFVQEQNFGNSDRIVNRFAKISSLTDIDVYKITLNQAGSLFITLDPPKNKDYDLYLVDRNGNNEFESKRQGDTIEHIDVYTRDVSFPQTVYIKVDGYSIDAYDCDSTYLLNIKFVSDDNDGNNCQDNFYEPNNSFTNPYSSPATVFGNSVTSLDFNALISNRTDYDYYKITTNAKGKLYIKLDNLPKNYNLTLYDDINNIVKFSNNQGQNPEYIEFSSSTSSPQTYYVLVWSELGIYDCTNKYHLNISWTPESAGGGSGQTLNCANAIPITTNNRGQFSISNQTNANGGNNITRYPCAPGEVFNGKEVVFKVDMNTDANWNLYLDMNPYNSAIHPKVFVFNACNLNNCIYPSCALHTDLANNYTVTECSYAIPRGTYYIVVDSKEGTDFNFNLDYGIRFYINTADSCPKAGAIRLIGFECDQSGRSYKAKFTHTHDTNVQATITATNGTLNNLGGGNYEISGVPSGEKIVGNIRVNQIDPETNTITKTCDFPLDIPIYTCECSTISPPTNPTHKTVCLSQLPTNISVSTTTTGQTVKWYDAPIGGTLLGTGATFSANQSGVYFAEVFDDVTSCTSDRIGVRVSVVPQPNVRPITIIPTCNDKNDGGISLVLGDSATYQFTWNTGARTKNISQLSGGNYTVTIVDTSNCQLTESFFLKAPPRIQVSLQTELNCNQNTSSSITVVPTVFETPLSYRWNTGDTSSIVRNVQSGTYRISVTDTKGCRAVDSIQIANNAFYSQAGITPVSCKGRTDGRIYVSAVNGEPPFSYQWNNGRTTPQLDSLRAGKYAITVTDRRGCISTDTIEVTEPDSLKLYVNKSNPTCVDSTNGRIAVYVDGGNGLYAYQWNTQATSYNLTNLSAGTFNVQVKDRLNCMASTTIDMLKPDSIRVNPTITPNPCAEQQKGAIALQVNGGKSPYKYVWQRGDTLAQIIGLGAGSYNVTVVDSNKCVVKKAYQVNNLPQLESRITALGTKCSYTQDGVLKIDTLMGFPPYQVGIDAQGNSANRSFANLTAGQHKLIIFDTYGCKWEKAFEIKQAPELVLIAATSNGDSLLKLGETTDLSVSSSNYTLQTVQWQPPTALACPTCPTTAAMPFSTTKYTVKVKTTEGCEGMTEKQIKVSTEKPVFAPTAFSPNGDGNNDYFTLFGPIGAKQVKVLRIYNRWGSLIFSRESFVLNDQTLGWDGTYKGQPVEEGIYIYYAEVEFVNGKIVQVQGDVSVLK